MAKIYSLMSIEHMIFKFEVEHANVTWKWKWLVRIYENCENSFLLEVNFQAVRIQKIWYRVLIFNDSYTWILPVEE